MTYKYEPWETYANKTPVRIGVYEPPCSRCKWFSPRVVTNNRGEFDGVILCMKIGEMCNDFSCYEADPNYVEAAKEES